jgi:hypothetical protein
VISVESMDADGLLQVLEEHQLHSQISDDELEGFVFFGLSLYGTTNQERLIPHLIALYEELIARSELADRMRLNRSVTEGIDDNELSVNALLPFIGFEPEYSIVSTAVIDYCMYRETENDELDGVGDVIGILRSGIPLCPGGIVAGLLLLGDKRVTDLLKELPYLQANEDIAIAARTVSGFLYKPMIEFYLDWLSDLNSPQKEMEFGSLASGLVNMIQQDNSGMVSSVERRYGHRDAEFPVELVSQVPFAEYFSEIEDRMQEIANMETAPKIMPSIIERWREHRDQLRANA